MGYYPMSKNDASAFEAEFAMKVSFWKLANKMNEYQFPI